MNSPKLPIINYFIIIQSRNDQSGSKSLISAVGVYRRPSLFGDGFRGFEDIEPRVFECFVERYPFFWLIFEETVDEMLGLIRNRL